ncbi:MAG: hypothetical protein ACNA8W_13500, partial [Bradymonadaceae bacterium]
QACTPGEKYCHDSQNLLQCRANGSGYVTQPCGSGNACIGDACFSGKLNGESCDVHEDCAGQLCHCGTEESCPGTLTPAYCTQACDVDTCNGSEWCRETSHMSGDHHYDHCVRRCDSTCAVAGLACKRIPVKGADGMTWEQGCVHPGLAAVGQECTSDAQCLGGTCLRDYFSFGYCTRRCETGGCPSNAACVQLRNDEFWCSLLCGDGVSSTGSCPLNQPEPRFEVTCKYRAVFESDQVARVCTRT